MAPGSSRRKVSPSRAPGRTSCEPSAKLSEARSAGSGASISSAGMRSLAARKRQRPSMPNGTASGPQAMVPCSSSLSYSHGWTTELKQLRGAQRYEPEEDRTQRDGQGDELPASRWAGFEHQRPPAAAHCLAKHDKNVAACEQAADEDRHGPPPLLRADGSDQQQPFGYKAAAGWNAHQRQSRQTKGDHGYWNCPADTGKLGDPVVTQGFGDEPGGHKHGRLGERVGEKLQPSACPSSAARFASLKTQAKRKKKEQVANLGDGGISDQQFEALLAQGKNASK